MSVFLLVERRKKGWLTSGLTNAEEHQQEVQTEDHMGTADHHQCDRPPREVELPDLQDLRERGKRIDKREPLCETREHHHGDEEDATVRGSPEVYTNHRRRQPLTSD